MKNSKKFLAVLMAVVMMLSSAPEIFAYILPVVPSPSKSELSSRELENAALTRKAGAEGMVLLKNDAKTLPITKEDTVVLFGTTCYNTQKGGTGSGDVRVRRISDIYSAMVEAGVKISPELTKEGGYWEAVYNAFLAAPQIPRSFGGAPARGLAVEPDVAPCLDELVASSDKVIISIARVYR